MQKKMEDSGKEKQNIYNGRKTMKRGCKLVLALGSSPKSKSMGNQFIISCEFSKHRIKADISDLSDDIN